MRKIEHVHECATKKVREGKITKPYRKRKQLIKKRGSDAKGGRINGGKYRMQKPIKIEIYD